ncbi:hypothetical protein [Limnoglobus roseus]|uniref:hypothetical protein n=1 Tax=Limnoglobus roseus TaxID=2598579 RepID=UPI0011EAFD98|nr:hypothetical protein [Limnoglobus roseus]
MPRPAGGGTSGASRRPDAGAGGAGFEAGGPLSFAHGSDALAGGGALTSGAGAGTGAGRCGSSFGNRVKSGCDRSFLMNGVAGPRIGRGMSPDSIASVGGIACRSAFAVLKSIAPDGCVPTRSVELGRSGRSGRGADGAAKRLSSSCSESPKMLSAPSRRPG